ncbi:hypothetical protein [Paenibacillus radicis (ex Gao et al. 2016)]|uniref:Uncharacterized protein n=1 Tax=Paenibacillus radicis (ex Gao et al. 2016) TaxID=1737354 RepID=A0A917HKT6_9BACL|nr:hypothetical protein [Paenibacillus radicis (ex Gao et al. 2016)]GGG81413.1 hypothetical protein GCM10010918_43320 [Paenibacillus radicis (ex Gao et al. 2016)]
MELNNEPQTNPYNAGYNQQVSPIISVKEWMLMMLISIIPIVGIIMMFVWAFGEGNPTKKNYYKAALLWSAIVLVLYILIVVLFLGSMFAAFGNM